MSAGGHQLEPVLEIERPCQVQGGIFAQAEPGVGGNHCRFDHPSFRRRPKARDAGHVDRRLADVRLVEPVFRAIEANRSQVEPEDSVGRLERLPRGRMSVEKVLAHSNELCPLPRTENK
jgi:hypothetical protein